MRGLALALLLGAGCAATHATARPEPTTERAEIAALSARIAQLRGEWHFDAPPPAGLGSPARSPRCQTMAACADEICNASRRICLLAVELADDDARRACEAARADCARARVHASRCR